MPSQDNLVHQTSTGTGTGNLTLVAVNGKQTFDAAFGHGATTNVFDYFSSNRDANEWERGTGHLSDATTIVRDTVKQSSNSNSAVNFSAGTKDITNDIPAGDQLRVSNNLMIPQGRLTLTSGVARPVSDVSGTTTVYYTPAVGSFIPLTDDGATFYQKSFTELSQATTDTTKSPAAVANNSNYDIFLWNDSGTNRATRGPAWSSDTSRGTGAGTTELQIVGGVQTNKNAITNGPGANKGIYVGTIRSNGSATIDFTFGTTTTGGGPAILGVWNLYNQALFNAKVGDSTSSWNYTTATTRAMNGSNGNRVSFVSGLPVNAIQVIRGYYLLMAATAGALAYVGYALDSTTAFDRLITVQNPAAFAGAFSNMATGYYPPQTGFHYIQETELADGSHTTNFQGSVNDAFFEVSTWQ